MKKMMKCADGGKVGKATAKGTPFMKGSAKSGKMKMADGGMYESPKMMKDEVKYMQKGGAPKSLVKAEMKEHASMKKMKGK
jgi:hypothetical protein